MDRIAQGIANRPDRCTETQNQRIQDSHSQPHSSFSTSSCEELTIIACRCGNVFGLNPLQRFRLVGVGLSNFDDPDDGHAQSLFLPNNKPLVAQFPVADNAPGICEPTVEHKHSWKRAPRRLIALGEPILLGLICNRTGRRIF